MPHPEYLKCECRHCAGPIEFPAEGAGQSITCPHCGQTTALPGAGTGPNKLCRRLPVVGIVVAGAIVVTGVAWFVFHKNPVQVPLAEHTTLTVTNTSAAAPPGETVTNGFGISDIKLEKTPGSSLVYVTGKIRNLGDQQRYGVKLEFGLFDANDRPVGKATDFHQILEPKGDWNFKALVFNSKAASARLGGIHED